MPGTGENMWRRLKSFCRLPSIRRAGAVGSVSEEAAAAQRNRTANSPHDSMTVLRQSFQEWNDDDVPNLAAALAFYTALSLAPLLVIALRVAATFFGDDTVRKEIELQLVSLVGEQGKSVISEILLNARQPQAGSVATVMSSLALLFGASCVFRQLQVSLNKIWKVPPQKGSGLLGYLQGQFSSVLMVMGIAILLLAALIFSAALSLLGTYTLQLPKEFYILSELMNALLSLLIFTGIFAFMFKVLPDTIVLWRDVWLGAAMTAALFYIGKFAIGLYLSHSVLASSYGVAGSLVVLLLWVYYSSLIVFWGAEFTQVYAKLRKQQIPSVAEQRGGTSHGH